MMSPWQVVVAIASALSAAMACVAAWLAWRSQRRTERMFELQRRPWIRVILGSSGSGPGPHCKGGQTSLVFLTIENYGQAGAHRVRVGARFTASGDAVHDRTVIWAKGAEKDEWRGPEELVCPPGAPTSYTVVAPWKDIPRGSMTAYLHVYCDFHGVETSSRYYEESVFECGFDPNLLGGPGGELKLRRSYLGKIDPDSTVVLDP